MLSLVAGIAAAILGYTSLVFYAAYNTTLQQAVIFLNWVNIPPLPLKASRYNDKTIQVQDVQINDENGVTYHGWHYMATSPSRPSVLWLSGNGSNRAHPRRRQFYTRLHRLLDVNVIVFDYSGYGDSEGRPSEQQTMRDALVCDIGRRSRLNSGSLRACCYHVWTTMSANLTRSLC
eukprot:TRINITY_DN11449_c0_g1_i3.p1 TRINITY_DN11449_c0_g1~~TRINITY_DN11449_c0_g1_i3.p1  ORF type:complete len:176 (+),score=18.23 TRINITY_DN11449_c0_g1_i3:94-621(+)